MLLRAEVARLNQALEAAMELVKWYIKKENERIKTEEPRAVERVRY